jgi:two-component system chemotaxis sensor kinase CheA
MEQADAIKELFRDIPGLGTIADLPSDAAATRIFSVETSSTDSDLLDLFAFHVAKEQVQISASSAGLPSTPVQAFLPRMAI